MLNANTILPIISVVVILLFPFAKTLVFPQQKVTINNNIFIYQNKIESFTRDDSGLIPTTRMWRYKTA